MGIFGGMMKKPMFGQIPGLGMMQEAVKPPLQMNNVPMGAPMMPQRKPGFFSKGGGWIDALGAFGDAFSENGPVYAQQKAQQNRLMQQAQMAEQQRQAEREDYMWKSQYDRANPKPINNDTVNDLNWYKNLTEEDRKLYHQMKPVVGYMADGTPRIVNPMEIGQPQRNIPKPGTIEDGHEFIGGDPSDPKSWRPVSGGGGGNVTSGF